MHLDFQPTPSDLKQQTLPFPLTRTIRPVLHLLPYYKTLTIWQTVQIINPPIINFSQISHHFFHLWPNILRHFQPSLSSLTMTDQVAHPHKTTGTIILLYNALLRLVDGHTKILT